MIEAIIVNQYQQIVGALDTMFKEMDLRSDDAAWRWQISAGVGSCRYISKSPSESGLVGPAKASIIKLREQRAQDFPGSSSVSSCPYHRENHGCVLGDLKSPLCIAHIDSYDETGVSNVDELNYRFRIKSASLRTDIDWMLRSILVAEDPFTHQRLDTPEENNDFVSKAHEAIRSMTQHVKRFPILHNE